MARTTASPLLAVALAAAQLVSACRTHTRATWSDEAAAVRVSVATVALTDVAGSFEVGGVVEAQTTATLTARIVAPVRERRAASGDHVRAGQALLVLDAQDLAALARSARAAALSADQAVLAAASDQRGADAALTLARATYERVAQLHAKRSATPQELDDAAAALRAAEARAASAIAHAHSTESGAEGARAASEAATVTETFASIVAPFDGVITDTLVEPGNMVAPGMPLLRLEDTRGFRLEARVDASRVEQLSSGSAVSVFLDSGAHETPTAIRGTVLEISRAIDADARTFLVKIALPADVGLRSGMFGRARFTTRTRAVLTVPAAALVHQGQMTSAFVVEKGIARLRLLSVSGTEVLAGLSEGDVVVVHAPPTLADGRPVRTGDR